MFKVLKILEVFESAKVFENLQGQKRLKILLILLKG